MRRIIDLSNKEAKKHFLKGCSYFNGDMPNYISFDPILTDVDVVLKGSGYLSMKSHNPSDFEDVNYNFLANKDGKFAWRPFELIHPAIYVSLVNTICDPDHWNTIQQRWAIFDSLKSIECCSVPVISEINQKDVAAQVRSWWQSVEQRSLSCSLEYSHILHTDVTDCYGSIYTHSIPWAIHGKKYTKENKHNNKLLGNAIDSHIQACRYGQTNGISQGSVLMDFIAEIVLGYVDELINDELNGLSGYRILRYRDDYRIFTNSDDQAEKILKVISEKLITVGMKLGVTKTLLNRNVVEGSIKPDKLAGIDLLDLSEANETTIQKQLLRLHSFGMKYPNSGALRRLISDFHKKLSEKQSALDDLEVLVAIGTDIGFTSPVTFPVVAAILSHLMALAPTTHKQELWKKVRQKMGRVPYNGYQEIWLQRVTQPKSIGLEFDSEEKICQIVNGQKPILWENGWISSKELKKALDVSKILISSVADAEEIIQPDEVELFALNAWAY